VGEAIRRTDVDRSDLVITTKLPGKHHGFDETIASFEQSRSRLDLDWVDLYLIHWPLPRLGKYLESWRAMISLREKGLVRAIGVSNFTPEMLTRLIDSTGIVPVVNQVELHPYFPQAELRSVHDELGIVTESWSPFARKQAVFTEPPVGAAAEAHGVTPGQVLLRWHLQLGALPIPKSATPSRQQENLGLDGFELTDDEVAAITALGRPDGRWFDGDPETHEEF